MALNYRGVAVGTWLGVALTGLIAATLLATAIALWAFGTHTASAPRLIWVALGCLGVGAAGLYDDLQPARTRGLLRQLRLLASGRVTSGVVKLVAICVMVRSGETGGVLDAVLERLATNLEREVSLRHRIKSAMTYPVVVVCFVGLIMSAMLLFIVPQFKNIYSQLGGTLPAPTRLLLKVSDIFKHDFPFVVIVVGVAVWLLRRYIKTENGRYQWDKLKLRIPIFGSLFQKTALARFARVLGVLNRSGVPILQALDVVSETVTLSRLIRAVPPLRWLDDLGRDRPERPSREASTST